ncbi:transposase family protein [Hymenobacter psoromatis]|uniref:transposase family protein n=1 Tax=Hymenobacter psoromatis TaxID=1484116 RepID=UPI002FCDB2EE
MSKMYSGRTHDFTIYKEIFAEINLKKYRLHVDAGFVGIKKFSDCKFVFIPFKARKNQILSPFERTANQILAHLRVVVENVIAQLKAFFILRIENRMRKKEKLAEAFALCAELAYFKHNQSTY